MIKDKNLKHRSPEVQEIIGEVPHWLIRWGMTSVFAVVVILLALAWFVRYPETAILPVEVLMADGKYIAKGDAQERLLNILEKDQPAHIKLASYPFPEYGVLQGFIDEKRNVRRDGSFNITIALPNALKTSYNKKINYYENMTGTAEIIVRDMRLIERLIGSVNRKHLQN